MSDVDTTTESAHTPQPADTESNRREGVSMGLWQNYSRRVDILSTVIATILDMLASHPMIAPAVGPDFVASAKEASSELLRLRDEAANV